ncbi:MAG: sugar phosphate isomerase/epimerase, partial [Candidatus Shapirobacteria bacterium]
GIFLNIFNNDRNEIGEKIKFIKTISGLNHLEIWSEADLNKEDINWLKNELSDYQLIIHGPFTGLSLVSGHDLINKTTINIYKNFIDQAISLNAKLITIHTGKYPTYFDSQKAAEIFSQNFKELTNYANNKIVLTTENMPNKHGAQNDFPILTELTNISKLIPDINYTFDVGHCLENGEDYFEFILNNKDRIKNIHLHNAVKNGRSHYGLQLSGDLDTKKFINFLNEINYQNFLTIEVLVDQDKVESVKLVTS